MAESDTGRGGSERYPADKAADEIYDEFAQRLDEGDDPYEVLEVALAAMSIRWSRQLSTDS